MKKQPLSSNSRQKTFTKPGARLSYGVVGLVAASHLIHDVYTAFLPALLPSIIEKLSLSLSMTGFLVLLLRIPALLNPIFGVISDKIGLRFFVILSPLITSLAMSFLTMSDSLAVASAILVVAGVSSAAYHVPAPAIIKLYAGNKIGTGMSFFMFAGELARTIGPLVALASLDLWGLEGIYRVSIFGVLASVALYFQTRRLPRAKNALGQKAWSGFWRTLKRMRRTFLIIGGLIISKTFLIIALTSFLPTFLVSKGYEIWFAGAALSVVELAGAAGALASGTISDKIGRKKTLLITTIVSPALLVAFVYAEGWLIYPALVALGLVSFTASPVMMAIVLNKEKDFAASANGVYMTMNFAFGSLAALFFGILGDIFDLKNAYLLTAVLTGFGVIFTLMLKNDD